MFLFLPLVQGFLGFLGLPSNLLVAFSARSAFRVEVGCTSIALYIFSSINLFRLIALKVSFFMAGKFGGSTLYPFLIISLSVFLKNSPFFGSLKGASMAISVG